MKKNPAILGYSLGIICTIAILNATGVSITKYAAAS